MDRASSDLHLLPRPRRHLLAARDARRERVGVAQHAHLAQHNGHPVVCEHCHAIDVAEGPQALSAQGAPHVPDEDLRPLVEENLGQMT